MKKSLRFQAHANPFIIIFWLVLWALLSQGVLTYSSLAFARAIIDSDASPSSEPIKANQISKHHVKYAQKLFNSGLDYVEKRQRALDLDEETDFATELSNGNIIYQVTNGDKVVYGLMNGKLYGQVFFHNLEKVSFCFFDHESGFGIDVNSEEYQLESKIFILSQKSPEVAEKISELSNEAPEKLHELNQFVDSVILRSKNSEDFDTVLPEDIKIQFDAAELEKGFDEYGNLINDEDNSHEQLETEMFDKNIKREVKNVVRFLSGLRVNSGFTTVNVTVNSNGVIQKYDVLSPSSFYSYQGIKDFWESIYAPPSVAWGVISTVCQVVTVATIGVADYAFNVDPHSMYEIFTNPQLAMQVVGSGLHKIQANIAITAAFGSILGVWTGIYRNIVYNGSKTSRILKSSVVALTFAYLMTFFKDGGAAALSTLSWAAVALHMHIWANVAITQYVRDDWYCILRESMRQGLFNNRGTFKIFGKDTGLQPQDVYNQGNYNFLQFPFKVADLLHLNIMGFPLGKVLLYSSLPFVRGFNSLYFYMRYKHFEKKYSKDHKPESLEHYQKNVESFKNVMNSWKDFLVPVKAVTNFFSKIWHKQPKTETVTTDTSLDNFEISDDTVMLQSGEETVIEFPKEDQEETTHSYFCKEALVRR